MAFFKGLPEVLTATQSRLGTMGPSQTAFAVHGVLR